VARKKDIQQRRWRRKQRVRNRVRFQQTPRLRVSVFRSLNHIYGQLIDDEQHHTLASYSSLQLPEKQGTKSDVAYTVGKELAQRALQADIHTVCLDRGPYQYHGRVAAFAEGLRAGGLQL